MSIASKIQELRKAQGLSLAALAKASGCTGGYLSNIETGKTKRPSLLKLKGVAKALNVTVGYLSDENVTQGDAEDQVFCERFKGLSPETKQKVIKTIDVWEE